jgi:hypothetical protein
MSQTEGLYRNVIDDGAIDHAAWLRARAEKRPVGNCRRCNDHLIPQLPHEHDGRTDYQADCRSCGYSLLAPGGRVKPAHAHTGGTR